MPRTAIALIVFILLALTVPWWWIGREAADGDALPAWVCYTLAMTVVFAVTVAVLLGRFWSRFEEEDGDTRDDR